MHKKIIVAVALALLVLQSSFAYDVYEEEAQCMCPRNYSPVCGTDDRTYSNECVFKCIQAKLRRDNIRLELKSNGECEDINRLDSTFGEY